MYAAVNQFYYKHSSFKSQFQPLVYQWFLLLQWKDKKKHPIEFTMREEHHI